jgi:hypothetical protein
MSEQPEAATSSPGFDPARQAELGAHGRQALALTQGEDGPSIDLDELIATGYSYVDRPPAEIGRRPLLELAGRLLRLAGDDPGWAAALGASRAALADVDWEAQRLRVRNSYVLGEHSTSGKSDLSTRRSVPLAD